ncbi:LAME_0E08218g1_1 [Lachancea meyersii CBS 8951]|uniref:Autophagy-related protein 17 n=1 Tax=Lachancea meyersii CBS 8951 TaxID=1266667 RepID=A0A1G4JIS3_9SACH|nr:LAME_0E08218g1_1 [Lachancea meyersii CBS 8951]
MNNSGIEAISDNARRFLEQTQSVCHESNNRLSLVKTRIRDWQKYRSKLRFILDCIGEQCSYLANVLLKNGIGKTLIEKQWGRMVLVDLAGEMEWWQRDIQKMIKRLDSVQNILEKQRKSTLGDFISRDNSHMLDMKLDELPVIRKQVENISRQYQQTLGKVQTQLIGIRLKKLEEEFDSRFGDQCEANLKLDDQFTVEADQLEHELADFLKSFTDHFDKCSMLMSGTLTPSGSKSLYEIVERDDKELPAIDTALHEAAKDVSDFAKEVNALLDAKEGEKSHMEASLVKILADLQKHEEYILVFEGISKLIERFRNSCLEGIHQSKELLSFYVNFENSYHKLLSEVERRQETATKMSQILENCEAQLKKLDAADIRQRQVFLLENGDFLPETIWPNEIGNLSSLYTLDYSVRDV